MKMIWLTVLLVVVMAVINVGESWEEPIGGGAGEVIRVGGKVLCQDCTEGWNEWVNGHKPIKGTIRIY